MRGRFCSSAKVVPMEFRHLGRSGMQVSEISYGNWITHGSQVEEEQATACVRAALDLGITTFDTADVYAGTRADAVLGRALAGQRRAGPGLSRPPHILLRHRRSLRRPPRGSLARSRAGRPAPRRPGDLPHGLLPGAV